ncbi:hypothetical protein ACPOLB_00330 [Rubrivivax sp. RP6-9]|uniref:hypothetical protein n=1 Tax=Rubrivivax sp. RP6-9 TaxID=3415750 RepID=UPI003CC6BC36
MNTASFLQRALSARLLPTLYWLGKGGWTRAEQSSGRPSSQPGRALDLPRELELMRVQRPKVHAAYLAALADSGLSLDALPAVACDCSGFVCWALGVARDSGPWDSGWISTDTLFADALGAQRLFRPVERAIPGSMLVYPKPTGRGGDGLPGHVGIVTEADADGRATRVLHCAPTNYLQPPPAGLPHNAIAETGPELFDADPRTRVVVWRAFDAP